MKKTKKLFYQDPFLSECEAIITDVKNNGIICNQTIAFPESGGQEGDTGSLIVEGHDVPFIDTQKGVGRIIYLDDFPTISVDNLICHVISEEHLKHFKVGMTIKIKINIDRRIKLTINHSGIHLVLMAIEKLYPEMSNNIKGAHIKYEHARLDFVKKRTFSQSDLEFIKNFVDDIIKRDESIMVYPHPKEPEALYWKCQDKIYPCGGTHITSASYIGPIKVKRKGMGKKLERVIASFPDGNLPLETYH